MPESDIELQPQESNLDRGERICRIGRNIALIGAVETVVSFFGGIVADNEAVVGLGFIGAAAGLGGVVLIEHGLTVLKRG